MLRYLEVKEEIKRMISTKKTGFRMPSRTELAATLQTSRATVDKAIAELAGEGFISSQRGSGTFVSQQLKGVVSNKRNWCVIVPDISVDVYGRLARSVSETAEQMGINVIVSHVGHNPERQADCVQRLIMSGVDGFIIVPVITTTVEESRSLYLSLLESRIPFVFCNRDIDGVGAALIKSNDVYGSYLATLHLAERGYRHIAFLARQLYRTSIDRYQGYVSALQHEGWPVDHDLVIMLSSNNEKDCYNHLRALIESGKEVDGVFCCNDVIAAEAIRCVRDVGQRVSDDVGIIGYDNSDLCMNLTPALTSVSYRAEDIGRIAAQVLYKKMQHDLHGFDYYLIEPQIVERDSCLGRVQASLSPELSGGLSGGLSR